MSKATVTEHSVATILTNMSQTPVPRTMGRPGRKPAGAPSEDPAEESRRRQRRERNKQAAAKCRQKRLDTIQYLAEKVDHLKGLMAAEERRIVTLKDEKVELQFRLDTHRQNCLYPSLYEEEKPVRPVSLSQQPRLFPVSFQPVSARHVGWPEVTPERPRSLPPAPALTTPQHLPSLTSFTNDDMALTPGLSNGLFSPIMPLSFTQL